MDNAFVSKAIMKMIKKTLFAKSATIAGNIFIL